MARIYACPWRQHRDEDLKLSIGLVDGVGVGVQGDARNQQVD
jgi:hypothetical protein